MNHKHNSLFQPMTRKQMANRNRSSINMKNFKKFNAKRKWKVSGMTCRTILASAIIINFLTIKTC